MVLTCLLLARKLYLDGEYRECLRKLDELTTRARRDNSNAVEYCKKLGKLARVSWEGPTNLSKLARVGPGELDVYA